MGLAPILRSVLALKGISLILPFVQNAATVQVRLESFFKVIEASRFFDESGLSRVLEILLFPPPVFPLLLHHSEEI